MKRHLLAASALVAAVSLTLMPAAVGQAIPGPAPSPRSSIPQGAWEGTSTNVKGDFTYGKVSFTVSRGKVSNFIIEGVTVSGCGGYKSIVVPKLTISGKSISGRYVPVPGIDDVITVKARFAGGVIRGTFTEGPMCIASGRFVARPK